MFVVRLEGPLLQRTSSSQPERKVLSVTSTARLLSVHQQRLGVLLNIAVTGEIVKVDPRILECITVCLDCTSDSVQVPQSTIAVRLCCLLA